MKDTNVPYNFCLQNVTFADFSLLSCRSCVVCQKRGWKQWWVITAVDVLDDRARSVRLPIKHKGPRRSFYNPVLFTCLSFRQQLYCFQYNSGLWNTPYRKRRTSRTEPVLVLTLKKVERRQLWVRPFEWLKLNFASCVVHHTRLHNMVFMN